VGQNVQGGAKERGEGKEKREKEGIKGAQGFSLMTQDPGKTGSRGRKESSEAESSRKAGMG